MRTTRVVVCVSASFVALGAIAAGCVDNTTPPPLEGDAGFSFDAGTFDVSVPQVDATADATVDATTVVTADAAPEAATDAGLDSSADAAQSTTTIDFGLVSCGTGTASQTYTLTNPTSLPITYSASVPSGSVFRITSGAAATVAPGATGSITLAVGAIPTTSTAGTPITAVLTVTTNVPGAGTVTVPLKVTPQGGSITVSPALAAFGQVQLAYGGTPIPLTITNTGNAPVTLTFGAPTEADGGIDPAFGITYPGSGADASATIAAGSALGDAGATFAPTAPGADAVTFAILTTDPLCASATGIAMSGTGTTAQITVGPSPLQFGLVPCGDAGGPLQVTVTNSSPGPVAFTASLGLGAASPFTISPADGGTVPGFSGTPGAAVITVTPRPIAIPAHLDAGGYDDTLLVTPAAPFVAATAIALQESAEGAILSVTAADGGTFGTVESPEGTLGIQVINTGNVDAVVNVNLNPSVVDAGVFSGDQVTAPADGGPVTAVIEFQPTASQLGSTSLSVTTTAPICATLPAPIPITATGAIAVASFATTPIALTSTCGAGAGTQGSVTITNAGQGPLVIESAGSTSGAFTIVSAIPITIAPGGNAKLVVAAAAVGQGTAAGTTLNDTLSFSTNEISTQAQPRTVPVTVALSGANLSYLGLTANTLAITDCGGDSITVQNTGDVDAIVLGTAGYPNDSPFNFGGTFSSSGSPTVAAGSTQSDGVSANLCGLTKPCSLSAPPQSFDSVSAADAGSAGICIPLPPLTVTLNLPNPSQTCQQQCCQ